MTLSDISRKAIARIHLYSNLQIVTTQPSLLYNNSITTLLLTDESSLYQRSILDIIIYEIYCKKEKFRWITYLRRKIRRIFSQKHLMQICIIIVFSEWISDLFIVNKVSIIRLFKYFGDN